MYQTEKEKEESISQIKVDNCTITTLIKLKFTKNNNYYDLDKKELKKYYARKYY